MSSLHSLVPFVTYIADSININIYYNSNSVSVAYNGRVYEYVVDENRYIWIIDGPGSKSNIGQVRPLQNSDDVEGVVIQMLESGGY